jgi:hypothetical protein
MTINNKNNANSNENNTLSFVLNDLAINFTQNVLGEVKRQIVENLSTALDNATNIENADIGNYSNAGNNANRNNRITAANRRSLANNAKKANGGTKTGRTATSGRKTPKAVNRNLERVQATLSARKEPMRAEHLHLELNLPKAALKKALSHGTETGVLRTFGQKRGTTYELTAASANPRGR